MHLNGWITAFHPYSYAARYRQIYPYSEGALIVPAPLSDSLRASLGQEERDRLLGLAAGGNLYGNAAGTGSNPAPFTLPNTLRITEPQQYGTPVNGTIAVTTADGVYLAASPTTRTYLKIQADAANTDAIAFAFDQPSVGAGMVLQAGESETFSGFVAQGDLHLSAITGTQTVRISYTNKAPSE